MGELTTAAGGTLVAGEEPNQYLTFSVIGEHMAIGILDVKEIIEVSDMTRVPMTGDCIRGVINLRGNVVPVVDLSARLGGRVSELTKHSCIILVEIDTDGEMQSMGMLVDEVREILEIPESDIQAPPDFGSDIRTDFIERMGRVEGEFIILLDIGRVLSVTELSEDKSGITVTDEQGKLAALPAE